MSHTKNQKQTIHEAEIEMAKDTLGKLASISPAGTVGCIIKIVDALDAILDERKRR